VTSAPIKPDIGPEVLEALDIRVGTILAVEDVPKSAKLVRLIVDFGDHQRRILAGMKEERQNPREIEGRQALFVVNLRPKTIMGEISEGMLFDRRRPPHGRRAQVHAEIEARMRPDIVPGAVFPNYELSDHRGKHRSLSDLRGGDPLVLVLARGGFCPKERRQHEGLVQLHREMQVGYCRLVTISTDNLIETNEFRTGVGASWTFLSDPGRKVQKDLDIAEYTDPQHNPMIPHTLVLEPGLRVFKVYDGYWFFGRPTVEELRHDLRAVLQRCRPDWDITKAEQHAAWAQGDKGTFFPYGRTQAQMFAEQD
jgi:methionine--tRNA ligase beta chain